MQGEKEEEWSARWHCCAAGSATRINALDGNSVTGQLDQAKER
jgi:hypothetical protein